MTPPDTPTVDVDQRGGETDATHGAVTPASEQAAALDAGLGAIEKLTDEDRERAVETLLHHIAASIHKMLAMRRVTVAEMKAWLVEAGSPQDGKALDRLLSAQSGKDGLRILGVIAYALDFDIDFKVVPIGDETENNDVRSRLAGADR